MFVKFWEGWALVQFWDDPYSGLDAGILFRLHPFALCSVWNSTNLLLFTRCQHSL